MNAAYGSASRRNVVKTLAAATALGLAGVGPDAAHAAPRPRRAFPRP
ncbi:twin-arginine translocation signal domain-containing protein [Glutamicibacter nicotianae]|nr:twin-arginine translocation signal domain-containing protein [Glutamicibacter nicotianae]